jgi:CDP-2,3-bis-(O-geranylgeranyl)-sn-glycerol synthase
MDILSLILQSFWLFAPAGVANMSARLFRWVPFLDHNVDFNKTYRKKPILGSHKTYRGLFFGVLMAIVAVFIQKLLYPFMINYSIVDYSKINIFILGFLLGFGALFGDMIKSFFKRRRGIKPGNPWVPFDQVDWIVVSILLVSFYVNLSLEVIITSIILFGILHPITNILGHLLNIQKNKL